MNPSFREIEILYVIAAEKKLFCSYECLIKLSAASQRRAPQKFSPEAPFALGSAVNAIIVFSMVILSPWLPDSWLFARMWIALEGGGS